MQVSGFWYIQSCATISTIRCRTLSPPPPRNFLPLAVFLSFPFNTCPSSMRQPLFHLLSADLPLLDISHKWDHTTCGLSWLALSPVTYIIFKLYPRGILFIGEHLSTVRIYHIGFIHPPMSLWVVCLLWILLQWRFTYTVFSVDPRFSFHWSDMQKWNGWAIR